MTVKAERKLVVVTVRATDTDAPLPKLVPSVCARCREPVWLDLTNAILQSKAMNIPTITIVCMECVGW